MNKYKSINDMENRLLGIHSDIAVAMMSELLNYSESQLLKYADQNPESLFTKALINGLSDDEKILSQKQMVLENIPSESNNIYSNVRNFSSDLFSSINSAFTAFEKSEAATIDSELIDSFKNEFANNKKVQDFCEFYYAVKKEGFTSELNKMILDFLENEDNKNIKKIENWLLFVSTFTIISDDNNCFFAAANYLLFKYCLGEKNNQLCAKDFLFIYKNMCHTKKVYEKNTWIFFALYKVMEDVSDDEFEFIFKTANLIPDYYFENFIKACKSSGIDSYNELNLFILGSNGLGNNISAKEINTPQIEAEEFLYKLYVTGMFNFLNSGCPGFEEYKANFYNQFCNWTENSKIIIESILNNMAKKAGFNKDIINPFTLDYSDEYDKTDLKLTFAELIYTFKNISGGLNYDIINLINYIERKQCDYFVTKKEIRRDINKSEITRKKLQEAREKLGKIDKGLNINIKGTTNFLKSINSKMYVVRPMTVKVFIETDMCIYAKDESEMDYWWDEGKLRENFRNKHKKCLNNIYLYRLRDQVTHFRNYDITLNLMEDRPGRKRQLFESVYDGIQELMTIAESLNPEEKNQAVPLIFWAANISQILSQLLGQTKIEYVNKPLLDLLFDSCGNLKKEIFSENPDAVLDDIKFNSPKFPKVMRNSLQESLNFMFGVQSDFLVEHRYSLILYLAYLSFGIINPRKR